MGIFSWWIKAIVEHDRAVAHHRRFLDASAAELYQAQRLLEESARQLEESSRQLDRAERLLGGQVFSAEPCVLCDQLRSECDWCRAREV